MPLRADFTLDTNAVLAAIAEHRPAVIFIAYPNNPTGNLFDRNGVEAILRAAPGLVVIDEAYLPFAQDTWMPQLRSWPNLVVLRTLSKLGLAGIRLGYLAGDPEWITEFDKLRPPYNVNVLTLATADFLLEHLATLESQAVMLRAERSRVAVALAGLRGITVFPSAANFLLFRAGDARPGVRRTQGARHTDQECARRCIRCSPGCLRTTIGTAVENDAFLHGLQAAMESSTMTARVSPRRVAVERNTKETQIRVELDLDGSGKCQVASGVGFFDHMLDQIARHGMLDLVVDARGDLHIDGHHTVEDIGITFGQAFAQAIGDKAGVRRYGHAYVPLDEALSRVVIDLSGRPGLVWNVPFKRAMIGEFDVDLTHEFFQGFVESRAGYAARRQPARRQRAPPV